MKITDLCNKRQISDLDVKTPLLVPSFSSKGFPNFKNLHRKFSKYMTGSKLISAYDIYHTPIISDNLYDSDILFIDSGGYECTKNYDMSDVYNFTYGNLKWDIEKYEKVLTNMEMLSDIIIVNYDLSLNNISVKEQIKKGKEFFDRNHNFFSDFLIKPIGNNDIINIDEYIKHIEELNCFDILGFTEKELGKTLQDRLINLLRIRKELIHRKIEKPIHIFGCIDPISSWLYFIFGADIFDGLSWLRYSYLDNGKAVYSNNVNVFKDWRLNGSELQIINSYENLNYINETREKMLLFVKNYLFDNININQKYIARYIELLKRFDLI